MMQNTKMDNENYSLLLNCVICGAEELDSIYSVDNFCLTGFFPETVDVDPVSTPLTLVRCRSCGSTQMREMVNPDLMFREYWYRSSTTKTMKNHLHQIAERYSKKGNHWLDIGCNDGTLMDILTDLGVFSFGVDPSTAVNDAGCDTKPRIVNGFFDSTTAGDVTRLSKNKFDVISAISMFYDVPSPVQFLNDISSVLAKNGTVLIEVNYAKSFFQRGNVDMLGHEHLVYYTIASFKRLLRSTKLNLVDAYETEMNGGNITFVLSEDERSETERLVDLTREEDVWLSTFDFGRFADKIDREFRAFKTFLWEAAKTKSIKILGASTRGAFIAQLMKLDSAMIASAVDLQINKKGRRIPGTDICIEYDPEHDKPDAYLVMPYQFKKEIIERYTDYLKKGGELIFYRPKFTVVAFTDGEITETTIATV